MRLVSNRITRHAKSLVERSLGVSISPRRQRPNKHSDEALRGLRKWSSRDVVFDVGANDGRTALRIQEDLGSPQIFAFEPVSSTFDALVARTQHLKNVRCFKTALGAKKAQEKMYVGEIAEMNSFSPQWATPVGSEIVEITTVDDVMQEQGIELIHYLKIDTEGYDLEVLKGARQALASSRVALLQVEAGFDQMDKELTTLEEIRVFLAPLGYLLYGIYNQCRTAGLPTDAPVLAELYEQPKVLAYCDALFVRADRRPRPGQALEG